MAKAKYYFTSPPWNVGAPAPTKKEKWSRSLSAGFWS